MVCWLFIWAESEAFLSLAIFPIFKLFSIYKHIIATRNYLQLLYAILNCSFRRGHFRVEMHVSESNFNSGIHGTYEHRLWAHHYVRTLDLAMHKTRYLFLCVFLLSLKKLNVVQ